MELARGESIYNLVPRQEVKKERSVIYKSRFNQCSSELNQSAERTKQNSNNNTNIHPQESKGQHKSMGPATTSLRGPQEFLRGKQNNPPLPKGGSFKYSDKGRKAMLPKQSEKSVVAVRSEVDYIAENALKNIKSVASEAQRNVVDSRKGSKQVLERSGLEPVFVFKKEYGRTPEYLEKRKEEMARNDEDVRRYMEERSRDGEMGMMSEGDKDKIILGLKQNWDYIYKEYLGLPMLIDTPAKRQHKERLEKAMKELETDVQLLQSHHSIYVTDY